MTAQHVELSTDPAAGHSCGCGHDEAADVVLDARTIPHAVRHAAVRGAFGAIPVGGSMILVAPHKPLPLLAQLSEDADGALAVEYLVEEPAECHVRLTRTAPVDA